MHKNMSLKDVLKRFIPYFKEYKLYFFIAIIGMLLSSGGTAGSAYMIEPVLNKIFIDKNETLLYILPLFVILAYFAKGFGAYLQVYYLSFIGFDILRRLRAKVLKNILNLDMEFFHKYRSGELISRCTSDIGALQSIASNIIPDMIRELISIIGLLSVVIYQSPTLAFFALIVIPVAIYPLVLFAKKLKQIARTMQEKNADLLSRLGEIFSNIELIKASNNEKKESAKFDKENDQLCKISLKSVRIDALTSPLMETMGSIGIASVIIIGGKEVIDGSLSIGSFFSFLTALFMAYTPVKRISSLYTRLQGAISASERTFYLLDLKPKIIGGDKDIEFIDSIKVQNLSFAYENNKVLKNVNFDFKKGQILALVGQSGGGKSSIISLLMCFYEKDSGKILINDKDISNYTIKSLRDKIALVTQNIYIFNDSIANNIAYSKEFNEEKIIKVLKLANAYEFVMQMGGINVKLFEHGKNLSGGQKQRIAIARALYHDPEVLIFDEATSALDNESERSIVKTIEALKKDRLILVIAHRLSTIENADKIAVLEKGEIIAIGNDEELMKNCEIYKNFKTKEVKLNK